MSLPSAEDLFRRTQDASDAVDESGSARRGPAVRVVPDTADGVAGADDAPERRGSGRVRHDEKMTVYVTADELLAIEHARLGLRAHHGLAVDRGRLVREALALVLAGYDAEGADSALVRRLAGG